jgi:hypothetical protein
MAAALIGAPIRITSLTIANRCKSFLCANHDCSKVIIHLSSFRSTDRYRKVETRQRKQDLRHPLGHQASIQEPIIRPSISLVVAANGYQLTILHLASSLVLA